MIDTLAPLIFTKKMLRQELLRSPHSSSFTSCLLVVLPPLGGDGHSLGRWLMLRRWYSWRSCNNHPRVLVQHCFQEWAGYFFLVGKAGTAQECQEVQLPALCPNPHNSRINKSSPGAQLESACFLWVTACSEQGSEKKTRQVSSTKNLSNLS